jgi:hypothetical protein
MAKKKKKAAKRPQKSGSSAKGPTGSKAGKGGAKRTAATKGRRSTLAAYKVAVDPKKDSTVRREAFAQDPTLLCQSAATFSRVVKVLEDPKEPIEVRMGAFDAIGVARFSAPDFDSCRAAYIAALRKVAMDEDPELRQRALGALARERDGFAQKHLLAGLKNPDKALVPPEKALQLLGYDLHAEVLPIAREIVERPPNALAKEEALRLLGSDPKSAPILEKILRDKSEPVEARQICATALHVIDPSKYQKQAREMLLDKDEHPDMQSMSLTAVTYFGDQAELAADKPLRNRVDELNKNATAETKAAAKRFIAKYE